MLNLISSHAFICAHCLLLQIQKFLGEFIFINSVKRHICHVKCSQLGHDLPKSENDRVILTFLEGFILTSEVLRK